MPAYIAYDKITGTITKAGVALDPSAQINTDTDSFILSDHDVVGYKINVDTKEIVPCEVIPSLIDILEIAHKPDAELNIEISKISSDVDSWRLKNYSALRQKLYPSIINKIDAEVKISSDDPEVKEKGLKELDLYNKKCLNIKTRFPKEAK